MATTVAIENGTLAYRSAGSGVPIIFIAGLGGQGAYWNAQIATLSATYRVVTYDHRGVGASEGAPPYSVGEWVDDTVRLIDHLELDCVHLVGHSTGGIIAQSLACTHPDRVATLALSGTWARPDARFVRMFTFRKQVLVEMGPQTYQEFARILAMPAGQPMNCDKAPRGDKTPPEVVVARIDALLAYDAGDTLRRIRIPTLVVAADDDMIVPADLSAVLAAEIPGARFVKLENGGHHFPQTQSAAYNGLLADFIADQPVRRASWAASTKA